MSKKKDTLYEYREMLQETIFDYKANTDFKTVPKELLCSGDSDCLSFGFPMDPEQRTVIGTPNIVGLPMGEDGHCMVIGGSGGGKSTAIAKPALLTWHGPICCTDIKGELSSFDLELYEKRLVSRKPLIFNPTLDNGVYYDPYHELNRHPEDICNNMREIAQAIIPIGNNLNDKYWKESAQNMLYSFLLYFYNLKFSFKDSVLLILDQDSKLLIEMITNDVDIEAKRALLSFKRVNRKIIANIATEISNALSVFANKDIQRALSGGSDNKEAFTWDYLDDYNIFLNIPEYRIEQWSGVINLMYTQLIHYLEKRPDKYSAEGRMNKQVLILMDEFAKFQKLSCITSAVSTLRSKSVNFCIIVQSLAQLDNIYGVNERRIILDNCQYKAILSANDSETQEILSKLVGDESYLNTTRTENDYTCNSISYSKNRRNRVYPHELAQLNDVILITPYGNFIANKIKIYSETDNPFKSVLGLDKPKESTFVVSCVPINPVKRSMSDVTAHNTAASQKDVLNTAYENSSSYAYSRELFVILENRSNERKEKFQHDYFRSDEYGRILANDLGKVCLKFFPCELLYGSSETDSQNRVAYVKNVIESTLSQPEIMEYFNALFREEYTDV